MAKNTDSGLVKNLYQIYAITFLAIAVLGVAAYFFIESYLVPEANERFVLLCVFLGVVFLLALGVVYPSAWRLKMIIRNLKTSETNAKQLANQLTRLNKEVKDINFALEEGTILIRTDSNGRIIYANDGYCEITKYTLEELIGKMLFEHKKGRKESIIYEHIRSNSRNKVWRGEVSDHGKDDELFWLDVTLIPIISKEGDLYQFMAICYNATQRRQAEEELKEFNDSKLKDQKIVARAIISGQELERKRMAQEIHDGVGQMLTGLKFGLESVVPQEVPQRERVNHIKHQLQDVIREIRRISSDLRPAVLSDFGVIPAIKDLVKTVNMTSSIPVFYDDATTIEIKLHKAIEVGIYRVVQEALNNALKHAQSTEIRVSIESSEEELTVRVEDNGIGFNLEEKLSDKLYKIRGNGLASMGQRSELMQGKLKIESQKNEGTFVELKVPLETLSEFYGNN